MAEWYEQYPVINQQDIGQENWYDKYPVLNPQQVAQDIQKKKNIFSRQGPVYSSMYNPFSRPVTPGPLEVAAKGLIQGTERTLAHTVGSPIEALGENLGNPQLQQTGKNIKDFFNRAASTGWEAEGLEFLAEPFGEHPFMRTIFNVASSAPLMAGALAITAKTKNPLLGASIFGPSAFGSFYDEARKEGVDPQRATALALGNAAAQVGLEASLTLSGWLKGGSPLKRIMRAAWQEGGEEVLQQWSENALRGLGWRGFAGKSVGQIASELNEGALESGIAGAVMGALMGPFAPPTVQEMLHDAKTDATKKLRKYARERGLSPESEAQAISTVHAFLDDYVNVKKKYNQLKEKLKKDLPYQQIIKGMFESTNWGGTVDVAQPRYDKDVEVKATKIASQAFNSINLVVNKKKLHFGQLPQTMQDFFANWVTTQLMDKVNEKEIEARALKRFPELMDTMPAFIVTSEKKGDWNNENLLGFFVPLKRWISAKDMGKLLHSVANVASLDIPVGEEKIELKFDPFAFRVITTREQVTGTDVNKGATKKVYDNILRQYRIHARNINAINQQVEDLINTIQAVEQEKVRQAEEYKNLAAGTLPAMQDLKQIASQVLTANERIKRASPQLPYPSDTPTLDKIGELPRDTRLVLNDVSVDKGLVLNSLEKVLMFAFYGPEVQKYLKVVERADELRSYSYFELPDIDKFADFIAGVPGQSPSIYDMVGSKLLDQIAAMDTVGREFVMNLLNQQMTQAEKDAIWRALQEVQGDVINVAEFSKRAKQILLSDGVTPSQEKVGVVPADFKELASKEVGSWYWVNRKAKRGDLYAERLYVIGTALNWGFRHYGTPGPKILPNEAVLQHYFAHIRSEDFFNHVLGKVRTILEVQNEALNSAALAQHPFDDRWFEHIVQHEIIKAAEDNQDFLLLPTPLTNAYIEGHIRHDQDIPQQVGQVIEHEDPEIIFTTVVTSMNTQQKYTTQALTLHSLLDFVMGPDYDLRDTGEAVEFRMEQEGILIDYLNQLKDLGAKFIIKGRDGTVFTPEQTKNILKGQFDDIILKYNIDIDYSDSASLKIYKEWYPQQIKNTGRHPGMWDGMEQVPYGDNAVAPHIKEIYNGIIDYARKHYPNTEDYTDSEGYSWLKVPVHHLYQFERYYPAGKSKSYLSSWLGTEKIPNVHLYHVSQFYGLDKLNIDDISLSLGTPFFSKEDALRYNPPGKMFHLTTKPKKILQVAAKIKKDGTYVPVDWRIPEDVWRIVRDGITNLESKAKLEASIPRIFDANGNINATDLNNWFKAVRHALLQEGWDMVQYNDGIKTGSIILRSKIVKQQQGAAKQTETKEEDINNIGENNQHKANTLDGGPPPPKPPKTTLGNNEESNDDYQQLRGTIGEGYVGAILGIPEVAGQPKVEPRNVAMRVLIETLRLDNSKSKIRKLLETQFGGKEKLEKVLYKKGHEDLQDEIITNVYGDKVFRQFAEQVAREQFRPVFETVGNAVRKKLMRDPNFQQLRANEKQRAVVEEVDRIMDYMSDAHEEIFAKDGTWAYDLTDIGKGGAHPNPEAARGFVRRILMMIQTFKIPFADVYSLFNIPVPAQVDQQSLITNLYDYFIKNRPTQAFFTLLGHRNVIPDKDILQRLVTWTKAEIEFPLLRRMMEMNVFKSADMWRNIKRGFVHKAWDYTEEQKRRTISRLKSSFASQQRPETDTATYQEFLERTGAWHPEQRKVLTGVELQPLNSYAQVMMGYIRDSLLNIQQMQTLGWISRMYLPPGERQLRGFENDKRVNKIIPYLKMAEYESSKLIKALAKITGKEPNAILQDLGYVQAKEAEGLAKWYRGAFQDPYLYAPLAEMIATVYEPHNVAGHPVTALNKTFNRIKRVITMNPFDSTFLWMSAVLVNTNPVEVPAIAGQYGKEVWKGLVEYGPKQWRGEYIPTELEGSDYPNLPLFQKHGFSAFNYQSAMRNIWDEEFKTYPEWNAPWENKKEYIVSFAGINTAIFNHMVAQRLYHVINKRFEMFLNTIDPATGQRMDEDTAARRAVKLISDTSGVLNSEQFGAAGKWYTLGLFTRGLTVGFIKTVTGAMYPILEKTGLHKYRTGKIGRIFNPLVHGETSIADMHFLSGYYIAHIGKIVTAKVLIDTLLQYALSYLDDDEWDEHGNPPAKGDPLAKKRFMFLNEGGKRFSVRTPWKNYENRRIYMDFQILREAQHLANILGGWVSKDWGYGGKQWIKNRLNTFPRWMANILTNVDDLGRPITDRELPTEKQMQDQLDFLVEEMTPIGPWKPTALRTGKKGLDTALLLSEGFGASMRQGLPVEQGFNWVQAKALREQAALGRFFQKKIGDKARKMTNEEILREMSKLKMTPQQLQRLFRRRVAPTFQQWKATRSVFRSNIWQEMEE